MRGLKYLRKIGVRGAMRSIVLTSKNKDQGVVLVTPRTEVRIHKNADIEVAKHLSLGLKAATAGNSKDRCRLRMSENSALRCGSKDGGVNIGPDSVIDIEGTLEIEGATINSGAIIVAHREVKIGSGCAIGWNVQIMDSDQHTVRYKGKEQPQGKPIRIEDNVWIGSNVIVKKGVTVGEGSIIAAGSVVTKDIPSNVLAAGAPAEVKKKEISWS